jgi:D-galactarolactone isomerase
MTTDEIEAAEDLWNRLASPIVFDHMRHVPAPAGVSHPVVALIRRLVDKGRTWVKLSVTYDNTRDGPSSYRDIRALRRRT